MLLKPPPPQNTHTHTILSLASRMYSSMQRQPRAHTTSTSCAAPTELTPPRKYILFYRHRRVSSSSSSSHICRHRQRGTTPCAQRQSTTTRRRARSCSASREQAVISAHYIASQSRDILLLPLFAVVFAYIYNVCRSRSDVNCEAGHFRGGAKCLWIFLQSHLFENYLKVLRKSNTILIKKTVF